MSLATPADVERRRALRRMRLVATSLLVLAAVVFLLTLRHTHLTAVGFVNAAAEAAMVGALADWFAVTALFRHPLGLPIPHTALIKRRKDELGRSLQSFVADHFLTPAVVTERLASLGLGERLGRWLDDPAQRRRVLTVVTTLSTRALSRVRVEDLAELVEETLLPRLRHEELSPIAGAFLEGIVDDGAHHNLVDLIAREVHTWVRENPEAFAAVVGERAPRWSPGWLDRQVVGWSYHQALDWLRDLRDLRAHPARRAIDDLLHTLARDLQDDPQVRARAEELKARVLDHPQTAVTVVGLAGSLQRSLLAALDDPTSSLWARGDEWLAEFGSRLRTDEGLRAYVEARASEGAEFVVGTYGPQLATIISYTVDRWDADEASDRIELFVGRDLQFIRINGTVVGALAGVVIHAVSLLVR